MALKLFKRLRALRRESSQETAACELAHVQQTVDPLRHAGGPYRLKVVCLDVDHGDSTLLILPSGRVALVDSAKDEWCERRVIPFLERHQIGELAYYINTHYHEDHVGQRERLLKQFHVKEVWDYRNFEAGQVLDFEGVRLTILNAYADAEDENDRSLAFRLELDGFSYTHGADVYASGQRRIAERFPALLTTDVYRANHHFHGSVDIDYLVAADPEVIIVSAQEAVYQRVAYTHDFLEAVRRIRQAGGRLRDVCLTLERGNVLVYANGSEDWGVSTAAPRVAFAGLYP
ncbi:MAG: hypothetical protein H6707_04520 [Deltaproteobacteria bacterium]|nr:hypothetical protein [Deltaproteobacteria bacterium]